MYPVSAYRHSVHCFASLFSFSTLVHFMCLADKVLDRTAPRYSSDDCSALTTPRFLGDDVNLLMGAGCRHEGRAAAERLASAVLRSRRRELPLALRPRRLLVEQMFSEDA